DLGVLLVEGLERAADRHGRVGARDVVHDLDPGVPVDAEADVLTRDRTGRHAVADPRGGDRAHHADDPQRHDAATARARVRGTAVAVHGGPGGRAHRAPLAVVRPLSPTTSGTGRSREEVSVSRLRLIAVHAHPDDESSKGAATTARYAAQGVDVLVVTCTG